MSEEIKQYQAEQSVQMRVDADSGRITGVSLMAVGEAKGHGEAVDLGTLQALFRLAQGRALKAHINHSFAPAPTDVIGFFSGLHIDGDKLRGDFTALKSWRTHKPDEFARLFEIAATEPTSFGVSLVMRRDLELSANSLPLIRPTQLEAADFVSMPAANDTGLFAEKKSALEATGAPLDKPKIGPTVGSVKAIYAKFSDRPALLAYAVKLLAEGTVTDEEGAIAETDAKAEAEAKAALQVENEALKTELAALRAQLAEVEEKMGQKEEGISEVNTQLAAKDAEVKTLKAELENNRVQLAALTKSRGRYGAAPINLQSKNESETKALTGLARTVAALAKQSSVS